MIKHSDRAAVAGLVEKAVADGARRQRACEEVGISVRTLQRWTRQGGVKADGRPQAQRPAPANRLTEAERRKMLEVCNSARYRSLPPSQIVPMLADEGRYLASESSFYRLLGEAGQQQRRGRSRPPRPRPPATHRADGPNQVWCWDISWLPGPVRGLHYYLYLMLDLYSRKITGFEVHETESAEQASLLVRKAHLAERVAAAPLVLHSDNGSPMKGSTMLATLQRLGVIPSFSRPRVSNDNAYAEALFRTCKYRPQYPHDGFASLAAAREWMLGFVRWYNHEHRHSGLKFVTPQQRHSGAADAVTAGRNKVYAAARQRHPERWSGGIRNWNLPVSVTLNPEKDDRTALKAA